MSHFSQVKTQIKSVPRLKRSLARLGFELDTSASAQQVRGFFGETQHADMKFHAGRNYDIGFIALPTGEMEMVGDWEILPRILGKSREAFTRDLKREYARATVEEVAEAQGLILEEIPQSDGQIEYVLSTTSEVL